MEIGKLSSELLERLIFNKVKECSVKRKEVVIRPDIGEDCAVADVGNEYVILSADPITGACENIGKLLVNINANDIYSCGGEPVGLLITLLLPPSITEGEIETLSNDIFSETAKAGLEVLGGHTEVTDCVNRPVVSAAIIGKSRRRKFIRTGGAEAGQDVIMTKWAGLEGTSVLANDYSKELERLIDGKTIEKAKSLDGLLSVKEEGLAAAEFGASAMHDVTEGGILGACYEIAERSHLGITVYESEIPVLEETLVICRLFNVNPLRLISSGSMVITCYDGEELVNLLESRGVKATVIGKMTNGEKLIKRGDGFVPLTEPEPDHIYKAHL